MVVELLTHGDVKRALRTQSFSNFRQNQNKETASCSETAPLIAPCMLLCFFKFHINIKNSYHHKNWSSRTCSYIQKFLGMCHSRKELQLLPRSRINPTVRFLPRSPNPIFPPKSLNRSQQFANFLAIERHRRVLPQDYLVDVECVAHTTN